MKRCRGLAVLVALGAAASAVLGGSSTLASTGPTTTLTADVVHNLSLATVVGPLAGNTRMTVGVVLQNPHAAAESAYLQSLYDPTSSTYEQFLDPDQFNLQFGVPSSTVAAAQSWLAAAGLSVQTVDGATNYLLATGTAGQIAAAFATPLNRYTWNGRSFYANALAPVVPASIPVLTVLGLTDFNHFRLPKIAGNQTYTTTSGGTPGVPNTGLLHPRDLWSIYDQPDSNLGNGQSMAILGWGLTDPVLQDLRNFEAENALPAVPLTIKYYGDTSTPDTNDGGTVEWELDTQASTGMAPNVTSETLYFAHHNSDADILAALTAWVNDKKAPPQASASFGECENVLGGDVEPVIGTDTFEAPGNQVLEQAVVEGRTLFASTGDTGSSCPLLTNTNGLATQVYPGLEFPSSSPWAVAVGGTVLNSDGGSPPKRSSEVAWEYGGGGNSTSQPAGPYQSGVARVPCVTDESGNPYVTGAPLCRATPDVAAQSGDVFTGNGMMITDDNGVDQQGAGTSLSSPLWLGMWTRIQAAAGAKGKGLGFANFPLYGIGKSTAYGDSFYDVVVGDNQPYPATPGWDNATGWGSPDVAHLMQRLTGRLTPVHNTTPAPVATFSTTSCGALFSDPTGDDNFDPQGAGAVGGPGLNPQLDLTSAKLLLTPDGQTLRVIANVNAMSATIPIGGAENDYNVVWTYNGTTYFTQLAVEPGGVVNAYDGQLVKVSLENRYQQLHVDTGSITVGPNGTAEVDVPLANVGSPPTGAVLPFPTAQSYVRVGVLAGSLQPADAAGPGLSYLLAGGC